MKKTLNEQVSRIKDMMKKIVNESYDYDAEEESYINQKEELINRYKNGEIDKYTYEEADAYLEDNHYDFWMDGLGVDYVLQQIRDREPSDDQIFNGVGVEGGISYKTGGSISEHKMFDKNSEPYFGSHGKDYWVGASGRNYGSMDFNDMGDFDDDDSVVDYDDLMKKYPDLKTDGGDKWYGASSIHGYDSMNRHFGPLLIKKRRIPEIGTQSSVEDDDYDERQERNYGVEDI